MKHFKFYSKEDILSLTKVRRFETRMGERVQYLKKESEWPEVLQQSSAKYVLLGIPEDIGIKANYPGVYNIVCPHELSFTRKSG